MTPQQISDYKMRWMPGYTVRLHSDLDVRGKEWCRRELERHQWSFTAWTYVYEHTFHFEDILAAQQFATEFEKYANQERI
jgi:hypothetical protein